MKIRSGRIRGAHVESTHSDSEKRKDRECDSSTQLAQSRESLAEDSLNIGVIMRTSRTRDDGFIRKQLSLYARGEECAFGKERERAFRSDFTDARRLLGLKNPANKALFNHRGRLGNCLSLLQQRAPVPGSHRPRIIDHRQFIDPCRARRVKGSRY